MNGRGPWEGQGTPLLDSMLALALRETEAEVLLLVNADIILFQDLLVAPASKGGLGLGLGVVFGFALRSAVDDRPADRSALRRGLPQGK